MGVCLEYYKGGIRNEAQMDQSLSDILVMHRLHKLLKARGMKILRQRMWFGW